tara:strand:- start:1257 stop:1691 length:435 start_codon:yes stop_codon:yes gene_type:complete
MNQEKIIAIKNIVNSHYNIDINLTTRTEGFIKARAICYKILREECLMTYPKIGLCFRKNHATIMNALKQFPYMLLQYPQMKRDYHLILATWKGQADEYVELKPLQLKKELNDLREQNKMLNLCLIDVQEELKDIKNSIKFSCQE